MINDQIIYYSIPTIRHLNRIIQLQSQTTKTLMITNKLITLTPESNAVKMIYFSFTVFA